jgi:hypothetical protein
MTDEDHPLAQALAETPASEAHPSSRFGLNLLDRAKTAKDHAQSSVTGLASRASDAAANTAGDLKEHVAAKANELKDAGLAKLLETLADFNAALPVIREAGYTLSSVDIGIGIPPKVTASFLVSANLSTETVERLLAEHAERKLTTLLVKSLHQAWQIHNKVKIAGLQAKSLSVEIGLVPTVTVKFA